MKELLTYIARNLVEKPDEVSVNEIDCDGEIVLELRVAPEDMGKVIGRQGRIAKEIRTVVPSPSGRTPGSPWRSWTESTAVSGISGNFVSAGFLCGSAFYSMENR